MTAPWLANKDLDGGGAGARAGGAGVREATPEEQVGWDARTVDVEGGDVQQSLAWAALRARLGWRVHHLVLPDGSAVLGVGWPFPVLGGGRLYLTRGPVSAGAAPEALADRVAAVAGWARSAGYDAVFTDAEVVAASGYASLLRARGFHQAEEVGPSRHRVGVSLPPGGDEASLLAPIAKTTRQRFFGAERRGVRIVRYDGRSLRGPSHGEQPFGVETPPEESLWAAADEALRRFHPLLVATGARRGFSIGPLDVAVGWWLAAMRAGHLVFLEALAADGTYLGAAIFFRHGGRWSYAHSGDVVGLRHDQPGTVHLILWRALQLAAGEGCRELDLGGVDVAGARREPRPGEPMHGLLEFKRSFGGVWIELTGAHERVLRPARRAIGDALVSLGRSGRRVVARVRGASVNGAGRAPGEAP